MQKILSFKRGWYSGRTSACQALGAVSITALRSNFMRDKIVERTFSGYRLNLPKGLMLTVFDARTGERVQINNSKAWMMRSAAAICAEFLSGDGI